MTDKPELKPLENTAIKTRKDKSLYGGGFEYLKWSIEDEEAEMDGYFSSQDLRAIAEHMEKHSCKRKPKNVYT